MNGDDGVIIALVHLDQSAVPDDPGVVDQDVDLPEGVDRGGDDAACGIEVVDWITTGHRGSAPVDDLADHLLGRVFVGSFAAQSHADVVDHHGCTFVRQAHGDGAADAATRTRD